MPSIRDVTIFPILDGKDVPSTAWCLDFKNAFSAELEGKGFNSAINNGLKNKTLKLKPGSYLLLEFNDDVEEFMGMVFTIKADGSMIQGPGEPGRIPRLTTWPPRP